ncbi:MAG: class I SAM-dependent methyltransferase [Chloroflexota bacterium]|nr:class I SAM-dependent methyltransferase [Chloroflexota bacterium]
MTLVEQPQQTEADHNDQRRDALVERLFGAGIGAGELATIYLGGKLGLYATLRKLGPATAAELAQTTGTHERSTREWLEQQAVAGILDVDEVSAPPAVRRYKLSDGYAEVLLDRDSLAYLGGLVQAMIGILGHTPDLIDAFHTNGAVPYVSFGVDAREGQASMNRAAFLNQLAGEWLPQVPDVAARLEADPPARVADIGCGAGWSSIALARAYPKVRVEGFDSDPASIELARANAREAGVSDRVSFDVCDVSAASESPAPNDRYDLVLALEALHDMGRPIDALSNMRTFVAEGGTILIMDERVEEHFSAPGGEVERFFYLASVLFCLPTGLADSPSAGTGAVMRTNTLQAYASAAGFGDLQVLPIEHPFWRFYRLDI